MACIFACILACILACIWQAFWEAFWEEFSMHLACILASIYMHFASILHAVGKLWEASWHAFGNHFGKHFTCILASIYACWEHLSSASGGATTWSRSKARPSGDQPRPLHGIKATVDTIELRLVTHLGRILAHRGRPRSRGIFDLFTILPTWGAFWAPPAAPGRAFERSGRPSRRTIGGGDMFWTHIWSI